MKKLLSTLLLSLAVLAAHAQCNTGVAAVSSGGAYPLSISYIQTFQVSCSGTLRNAVALNVYSGADDLRGSGVYVNARIRSSTGTILATSTPTDQFYAGATVTFDFLGANVSLAANTTYQLEFYESTSSIQVYLFRRSTSSVYANGFLTLDGTAYASSDIYGWTVNVVSGAVAASSSTDVESVSSANTYFFNSSNELIARVQPGTVSGSTTAKVYVQSSAPTYNTQPYVRRYYDISPASNANTATASVTLYYAQSDFDNYNTARGTLPALPTGPSDATGIANLRITQQHGASATGAPGSYTYTGGGAKNVLKTPASVTWNSTVSRWEVVVSVTGFSGFFAHSTNTASPLPLTLTGITASVEGSRNRIAWQTATESGIRGYEVERSANARDFSPIGSIAMKGGASNYSFYDEAPLAGVNYYRLRTLSEAGEATFSRTVSVGSTATGGPVVLSAYPNPAGSQVTIEAAGSTDGATVVLRDMSGRTVASGTMSSGAATMDVHALPAGIYLAVYNDGARTEVLRVSKQ